MLENIPIENCTAVFGKDECAYQSVLDDFQNTNFIGITTFNISSKPNSRLIHSLKKACINGTNAIIITNIAKRFPSYCYPHNAVAAKNMIDAYKKQLNPVDYGLRLTPYFAFNNHAKIIMTDNVVYLGSGNFSDESNSNYECGTISTDRDLIDYLKNTFFPQLQSTSVPYYKHNFAVAILNLEDLISVCKQARQDLFDAAFIPWEDYDTNFETKWIYRTTDSDLTVAFLRNFIDRFSQFDDALKVIDEIIDEYWDVSELPENVAKLSELFEEYKSTFNSFKDTIASLFASLEQVAQYDPSGEACELLTGKYGMVAYDEDFDYYAEKAMNEAAAEYEELIKDSKQTVLDSLGGLDNMVGYFGKLKSNLYGLLEVNSKIDNTGVR